MKTTYSIDDLKKIARDKKGECLSEVYTKMSDHYEWKCNAGHIFKKTANHVKRGQWCSICSGNAKLNIEEMREIAKEKGGKCLSEEYKNSKTELMWECKKGHVFHAIPSKVKRNRWCPTCKNQDRDIEDVRIIAKEKGGKLLSTEYKNRKTVLEWECEKGHKFEKRLSSVLDGAWCDECAKGKFISKRRWTIEKVKQRMNELGGKCLSDTYIDNKHPLTLMCEKGHVWKTRWNSITSGRWCPYCAGNVKKTIPELRELANKFDGYLLSEEYVNAITPLKWECKNGHVFEKSYQRIADGDSWCSICSGQAKRTLEEMQDFAHTKGGKCLSKQYIDNKTDLIWECKKGHLWYASPASIYLHGNWCHECRKSGIEQMYEIAESRGGKCLSYEYIDAHTHLEWECEKNHKWLATPSNIKSGLWCKECKKLKKKIEST